MFLENIPWGHKELNMTAGLSLSLLPFILKEMATHSSILAWRIPWTEEFGGLQSTGRKEWDTTEQLHFTFTYSIMTNLKKVLKFYVMNLTYQFFFCFLLVRTSILL